MSFHFLPGNSQLSLLGLHSRDSSNKLPQVHSDPICYLISLMLSQFHVYHQTLSSSLQSSYWESENQVSAVSLGTWCPHFLDLMPTFSSHLLFHHSDTCYSRAKLQCFLEYSFSYRDYEENNNNKKKSKREGSIWCKAKQIHSSPCTVMRKPIS